MQHPTPALPIVTSGDGEGDPTRTPRRKTSDGEGDPTRPSPSQKSAMERGETERTLRIGGWQAFRLGLRRALRYPQVLVAAYLVSLLSAGLLAVIPALALTGPAHRTAVVEAANGIDSWLVVEIMDVPMTYALLQSSAAGTELPPWLGEGTLVVMLVLAVLPLLAWIPTSFLSGGILLTYVENQPWRAWRFWWGCWHWWGPFLLLSVLQGLVTLILFGSLLGGAGFASTTVGGWLSWILIPLIGLLAVFWLALMETTRVLAVTGRRRNIFVAFGRAVKLLVRHPLALGWYYALALFLLGLAHLLFRGGLMPGLPLAWWPLVFGVTQAFILIRLWVRLARWAGLAGMVHPESFPKIPSLREADPE